MKYNYTVKFKDVHKLKPADQKILDPATAKDYHWHKCQICGFRCDTDRDKANGTDNLDYLTDGDGNTYPSRKEGLGCPFCGSGNYRGRKSIGNRSLGNTRGR